LFFARITADTVLTSLFKVFLRIALSLGPYLLSGLLDAEKAAAVRETSVAGNFWTTAAPSAMFSALGLAASLAQLVSSAPPRYFQSHSAVVFSFP
jgi:hypothetical protein